MKRILMLGCGRMGERFLEAAHETNLEVHLIETQKRINILKSDGFIFEVARTISEEAKLSEDAWIDICLNTLRSGYFEGILPFTETQITAGAFGSAMHDLPGPGLLGASASRRKTLQRGILRADLNPDISRINHLLSERDVELLGKRWVQKPPNGSGSHGVKLVELGEAPSMTSQTTIVESFVDLPEFSWDGIIHQGRILIGSLTKKITTNAPEFVEIGHIAAWQTENPELWKRVSRVISYIVHKFQIETSMLSVEFRADENDIIIMEFMTRMPGDAIWDVTSRALGVDLYALALAALSGEDESTLTDISEGSLKESGEAFGVAFLTSNTAGEFKGLSGSAADLDGFILEKDVGSRVGRLRGSGDRIAYKLLKGRNPAAVDLEIGEIRQRVSIKIE